MKAHKFHTILQCNFYSRFHGHTFSLHDLAHKQLVNALDEVNVVDIYTIAGCKPCGQNLQA